MGVRIMNLIRTVGLASLGFAGLIESALAGANGVPGPIVGLGLPALVIIGAAYWLGRKVFGP